MKYLPKIFFASVAGSDLGIIPNPYPLNCGKYLGISPKTHCEEYHRNPKVAGPLRGLASEKGNDPYLID